MNKLTRISAALVASLAIAGTAKSATMGAYVGVGLGDVILRTSAVGFQQANFGEKVFVGYNAAQHFGIEGAFTYFETSSSGTVAYSLEAINVEGKAYFPVVLDNKLNIFGLAGVALVYSKTSNPATTGTTTVRPVLGLGISYDFTPKLTGNVEGSRIFGRGKLNTSSKAIPNADMLSVGLAYNFG